MAEWQKTAEAAGFKCKVFLDDGPAPLSEQILFVALQEKCDMICMPSFASPLDTILVGSRARDVIRQSAMPVLVWPIKRDDGKVTLES